MNQLVEHFIDSSIADALDQHSYRERFENKGSELSGFCNEVALAVARRFLNGAISFEDADAVANDFYALYIGDATVTELPEPADAIYLAFDRGEYSMGDEDPVEEHTRPMLRAILSSYSSRGSPGND